MELPIQTDPEVLEHLYKRFNYLKDHSLNLRGAFIEEASCLGVLEAGDFLGFLLAYEEEPEPYPAAFPFLTQEENRRLIRYRHLRPVEPWPQPTIGVLWDEHKGQGVTLDVEHVDVALRAIGNVQLWYGSEMGVLWEAFFESDVRERPEHDALMHTLWEACERYLHKEGVRRVFTYARELSYDEAWYASFLHSRGYDRDPTRAKLPGGRVAVVKDLEP